MNTKPNPRKWSLIQPRLSQCGCGPVQQEPDHAHPMSWGQTRRLRDSQLGHKHRRLAVRSLTLAAIGWLAAATVHAQITYLTDARSVSGHGALDTNDFAGAVSISYSGDDSQSATPLAPFADFNTSLFGGPQAVVTYVWGQRRYGAAFSAAQTSALSPLQLSYSGSASAAQDALDGVASSASQFSVSFSVSNSIPYALRCTPSWAGGSLGWTLSSSSQGVIISENYPPSQDYSEHIYTGTFLPDQTYTLQANINVVSGFRGANPSGSLMVVCVGFGARRFGLCPPPPSPPTTPRSTARSTRTVGPRPPGSNGAPPPTTAITLR